MMTRDESKTIINRVKSYYPESKWNDILTEEWEKELKNYDYVDVNEKLTCHFKNEEYGNRVPKIHYLTKYLQTIEEKNTPYYYIVECPNCHQNIDVKMLDKHYELCSQVDYIVKKTKQYFNKGLNREQLMNASNIDDIYIRLLNSIIEKLPATEMKFALRVLYPNEPKETLDDMIKNYLTNNS